jgi:molybdopterin synthase sulfur carrier subunit
MTTVHLPPDLAEQFGAATAVAIPAATLADVVGLLEARHPGIAERLVEADGGFRPHLSVFAGGTRQASASSSVPLGEGTHVWVLRAVSGG